MTYILFDFAIICYLFPYFKFLICFILLFVESSAYWYLRKKVDSDKKMLEKKLNQTSTINIAVKASLDYSRKTVNY